jgi:hypothetical protein
LAPKEDHALHPIFGKTYIIHDVCDANGQVNHVWSKYAEIGDRSEWVDSLNKHFFTSYMLKNNDSCSTATTTIATLLILFPEALAHLSRLMRILEQPGGLALLSGQSGVGKKSLTKLVHILGYFPQHGECARFFIAS